MIIDRISEDTGLSIAYVKKLVQKAPYSYRRLEIAKRDGRVRVVFHPSAELKVLQRWVVEKIISSFQVHDVVYSYRVGRGVSFHAAQHVRNNFLLRVDFREFFPSITAANLASFLSDHAGNVDPALSKDDIDVLCRITCLRQSRAGVRSLALTIGAPSSPAISNAIFYRFDSAIFEYCQQNGVTYTRYADDLYFSTSKPNILAPTLEWLRALIAANPNPRLEINESKTVFTSRKRRRIVTGLVLSSEGRISLGRQKKRHLRGLVHRYLEQRLSSEEVDFLRGLISYATSVEPEFIRSLERKFGEVALLRIRGGNKT